MQGLQPVWFNRRLGKPAGSNLYTVGAMADSYFEYLLKMWLLHQKQVGPTFIPDSKGHPFLVYAKYWDPKPQSLNGLPLSTKTLKKGCD